MRQRKWSLIQETDESDTSIQFVVRQEEENMTGPIASEVEVPEARMSRSISEGLCQSRHGGHHVIVSTAQGRVDPPSKIV